MNYINAPGGNRQVMPSSEYADIVIVGNGIAGQTAALEARRLAPERSIVMITDQCHPTINTPALKQFATGKLTQDQLLAYPAGTERSQRIHVVNARVEGISAQGKYLQLQGGVGFGYGSLLLATGSKPNGLPHNFPGRDFDGVLTLHRLHDYLDLRRRLPEVESAVVVGGGAHAIETVMGLLHCGVEVHWLIRGETFLAKMLDRPASEMVLEYTRHAGAKIATGTEVVGIVGRLGSVAGVMTNHRQMIPCQLVLICTGTSAVTTLAEHCTVPMQCQQGILVDEQMRTSVRDIYAAGDVAALKNPQTGVYETHAQWYAAVEQARIVAASMTGRYDRVRHAIGVPWHATNLGELYMLTVGTPLVTMKGSTTLTDSGKKRYRRMSVVNDRMLGFLALGTAQPDSLSIKRIIDEGLSVRSIKKALLKGDFDARKYFSQWQSRTAQELVTSGKLPAISTGAHMMPSPSARQSITVSPSGAPYPRQTQPLQQPPSPPQWMPSLPLHVQQPQQQPLVLHELVGERHTRRPLPLPAPVAHNEQTMWQPPVRSQTVKPVFAAIYHQATIHMWDDGSDEKRPTTDKLTSQGKNVVESMLLPLPTRAISHTLWSYSRKVPVMPPTTPPVPPQKSLPRLAQSVATEKSGEARREEQKTHGNFML